MIILTQPIIITPYNHYILTMITPSIYQKDMLFNVRLKINIELTDFHDDFLGIRSHNVFGILSRPTSKSLLSLTSTSSLSFYMNT